MKKPRISQTDLAKVFLPGLFFLTTIVSINLQAGHISDTIIANQYYEHAKTKVNLGQLDSAIYYYEKSLDIYNEHDLFEKQAASLNNISEQNFYLGQLDEAKIYARKALQVGLAHHLTHQVGKSYNSIAALFVQSGRPDSATIYFEKALSVWLPLDGEEHLRIAVIYTNLGYMYHAQGDYQKSYDYTQKAIKILNKLDEDVDEYLVYNFNNLGTDYEARGMFAEAASYFEKAMQLWLSKYGENQPVIATLSINLGELYRNSGDYAQALLYTNKALTVFKKLGVEINQHIGACYTSAGMSYLEMGDYENAIASLFKAEKVWQKIGGQYYSLAKVYNNTSNVHIMENKIDSAIFYLENAVKIFKNNNLEKHPDLATFFLNLGRCYIHQKNFSKADDYILLATEIIKNAFGENHPELAACYRFQGKSFMAQTHYRKALDFFQKAIIANVQNFKERNAFINPELENILLKTYLLYTLEDKANAFYQLYSEYADSLMFLEAALNTGILAIRLLDIIRSEYRSENSKFFLSKDFSGIFSNTFNYSIELFRRTKEEAYYREAFRIAEKSKSAVLYASLIDLDAMIIGGIPDSTQKAARKLKHDIGFYDQKIIEEKQKEHPDAELLDKWQEIYFNTVTAYDKLVNSIEKNYPDYYDLKYRLDVASVDEVQSNLSKDEAVIEYMISDTILVAFVITDQIAEYFSLAIDSSFFRQLNHFRKILISKDFSRETDSLYREVAYRLYEQLIAPVEEQIRGKSLIIVPDGKLAVIPFETFLTSPLPDKNQSSKDYPYLIRDFPVVYEYSSTIMLNSHNKNNCPDHHSILAFAPAFQPDNDKLLAELKERGTEFVSLPGTKEEVMMIKEITGGEAFLGQDASENNFKQMAPGYQVLHIATHGIINDVDPMLSRLVFSSENDSIEDGSLNVFELYSLKLNADMAVLSACNSGYGKLQKGEGIMSMARAFLYTGVPAIVMSQWSVNDKSSALVMASFYQELKSGLTKSEALQKAKLNYLSNADKLTAHPYFWAGFVVIGNQQPVSFSHGFNFLWLLIIPALLVVWLIWYRKKN